MPKAQVITLYSKGKRWGKKPLPVFDFDLAFNCAEYCRGYYAVASTPRLIRIRSDFGHRELVRAYGTISPYTIQSKIRGWVYPHPPLRACTVVIGAQGTEDDIGESRFKGLISVTVSHEVPARFGS